MQNKNQPTTIKKTATEIVKDYCNKLRYLQEQTYDKLKDSFGDFFLCIFDRKMVVTMFAMCMSIGHAAITALAHTEQRCE